MNYVSVFYTVVFGVLASPAFGAIVTVPTSLNPGDQYRLAFVTSTTIPNTLSTDIGVYNTFVDAVGDNSVVGSDWRVIGSTQAISARVNTSTDPTPAGNTGVPIFLLNDTKLADHYDDLWDGSVDDFFNIDEHGMIANFTAFPATGTNIDGTSHSTRYLGDSGRHVNGFNNRTDSFWINQGTNPASNAAPLYAISGILEVSAVPEPSAFFLMALGSIGIVGCSRKQRRKSS